MIQLQKVSKTYQFGEDVLFALRGIDFTAAEGEFVAITGPSGSGKSTMLHIIGGLDRPTAGKVMVQSLNLTQASDRELARYRNQYVGFVFQTFNLYPTYNSLENVALPLVFAGIPPRERLRRALESLELVGLAQRASHLPSQLSGGERQRVAIARALVSQPRLILADEPTGNLDTRSGEIIVETLIRLNREKGITLLVVTHNTELAQRAPRSLLLRDGMIVEERSRD